MKGNYLQKIKNQYKIAKVIKVIVKRNVISYIHPHLNVFDFPNVKINLRKEVKSLPKLPFNEYLKQEKGTRNMTEEEIQKKYQG